jgi:hypothetical protein
MTKNLITKTGTVVHRQIGNQGIPVCAPNMARNNAQGITIPTPFLTVDAATAAVNCLDCCAKDGVEAPKRIAGKSVKPALDDFEVGATITTRLGEGVIVKLTKSLVTYTIEGEQGTFAAKRAALRLLNG